MPTPATPRIAVIGAGAAGLTAAIFAARAGADVILCEGTKDGGRKILISGGGRCNVLPLRLDESKYVTASSPNTLRKILRSWPLAEQRRFFEQDVGIALAEEVESAKVFPASHKARDVRDGLLALAQRSGVRLAFGERVTGLVPLGGVGAATAASGVSGASGATGVSGDGARGGAPRWRVEREASAPLDVHAVVLATGGLSVPQTGSDGAGLAWLRALDHVIHPTYAALTPLTAAPHELGPFAELSGVSLEAEVSARNGVCAAASTRGFLFTHRGYSGPALLDVSHVAVRSRHGVDPGGHADVRVRWTPAMDEAAWQVQLRPQGTRTVGGAVRERLPDRLAAALLARADVPPATPLAQLSRPLRSRLLDELLRCRLPVTGDEGYKKAEVMGGGLALSEVHPATLESRRCPGLHICGEVLDAFGPIGGYNFFWAWATGRAAGVGAATRA
jgi:predicted flavoprotein YhiN